MIDKKIIDYIKQMRSQGKVDESIKTELNKVGWSGKEVEKAFLSIDNKNSTAYEPLEQINKGGFNNMKYTIKTPVGLLIIIAVSLIAGGGFYALFSSTDIPTSFFNGEENPPIQNYSSVDDTALAFASEEDFKNYLSEAGELMGGSFFGGLTRTAEAFIEAPMAADSPLGLGEAKNEAIGIGGGSGRVSETNVQVEGIDEPDIVKTDGKEIYFSSWQFFIEPTTVLPDNLPLKLEAGVAIMPPPRYQGGTQTIKAFPPNELKKDGAIDKQGDLLLTEDILIVSSSDGLYGFDVANPSSPTQKWSSEYKNNSYLVSARLFEGKIYLVTRTGIDYIRPCPLVPFAIGGNDISIPCTGIYHPRSLVPIDATYSVLKLDPKSGSIEDSISFVGSSGQSVVYMSKEAVYITYNFTTDIALFMYNMLNETAQDLFPKELIDRFGKIASYDISSASKLMEIQIILEQFLANLDSDEELKIENELENRMSDYMKVHIRELEQMGIVKIDTAGLDIKATGTIPGSPLNQFSLDEYNGNLRLATTIGSGSSFFGFGVGSGANDVYVLNENLDIIGSVQNLGLTEQIYSARFIEDKGYLVTFRRTDPFYVLDLSDPKNPQMKGELKIPGFSSYLHPLAKDIILGVGEEDGKVKLSLFDVSSPENPKEADKYLLSEYWSDVQETHHAFLLDSDNKIFFLPAGGNGFIFTYEGNKLALKKAVSDVSARRALYINDYLYIVGDAKIVVLNEKDWEKVNQLDL